jgi:predicted ATPase/DNA-binding CsgD family transcriptional regulator
MSISFSGARIRALRQRLGLSQVEMAALLGISNVTVNRWENDRALPQPGTIERLLRMEHEGLPGLDGQTAVARGNLPLSFTPLIGRAADLAAVVTRLDSNPLVTITGTAGTGKTRLALETGRFTASRWPGGVWFVDLAAVLEPEDVLYTVARVIGVRESGRKPLADRLVEEFRARLLLLILDNCEHQRAECAGLAARLLRTESESRLLATSRVPLGVPGEAVYALRPLAPVDAEMLFIQRAREHRPELTPDVGQARSIAEICRRLDGLPLAIELAAARTNVLSVEQIAGRLDGRFDLLRIGSDSAPRHRALDTAIAWSCDLLGEAEATLFRRLGVFVGWFDLKAVEVVGEREDVLNVLDGLVRQSMIVVEHDASSRSARYRLLESLAAYARRWLEGSGETAATSRRHASHYGALAQDLSEGLRGPRQVTLLAMLDREHDNLIAALEWMLAAGEAESAIALTAALGGYWRLRGLYAEGISWLERALAQESSTADPERVAALNQLGLLQYITSRFDSAESTLAGAVSLARALGNRGEEARALDTLGLVLVARRELGPAAESHRAALALFQELGDRARAALSTLYLGNMANLRGEHNAAERAYHEAWSLVQGTGDTTAEALILSNLGEIAARTGRYGRALGYYQRTLTLLRALGDPDRLAVVAANTAEVKLVLGENVSAVPLAADAVAQFRAIANPAHLAGALYVHAAALAAIGQRSAALALFRESLALYHQMADWIDIVYTVEAIARLFASDVDAAFAARLLGGAQSIRERQQVADYPLFDCTGTVAAIRAALGSDVMAARWAEGQNLSPAELVADALHVGTIDDGDPVHVLILQDAVPADNHRDGTLTPRQIDVLRLVAAGHSNREIGQSLHISDRTVERHLTAIFAALDVDRRSAAVARATAAGLLRISAI